LLCKEVCRAEENPSKYRHLVYLDVLGIGGLGSINYEHDRILKNKFSVGVSGGFSTIHLRDYTRKFNPDLIFPLSLHVLYGNIHQIEIGVGQTISSIPKTIHTYIHTYIHTQHIRAINFGTTLTAGYRFQHPKTGLMLRCGYTPLIDKNRYYKHWGVISIGYVFK
jgi:hypothetical protein